MGTTGQSITLANSIIGVGILAMPFCFQQCGILLATLILLSMGLVSRLCCHFLLKSALLARRRNFEYLAFHVFGSAGKLAIEVGIIGFLMGTCIAYFVVVGDLGPQIISKMFNINQSDILRTSIMVIVSLVCVLPLGLLRNVDSLSNVSAATIGFYLCLVIKVIAEGASQFFTDDWYNKVEMWRPAGVLQCVPVFSMALFCQAQLFEIFESMPSLSLEKMNVVTKNAINICSAVYFTLGLFGYIAFSSQTISGNILMSLSPTMASDVIKLGFVMSIAFSFPLIIFPCRASLYSFLYKKVHQSHHDHIVNHSIPESTFRCITVCIIALALFVSLLIPNIELVLGLLGSTVGVLVCLVFPAACFLHVTFKNTNERLLAKVVVVLGLFIMVMGTYANLRAVENQPERYDVTQERIDKMVEEFIESRRLEKADDPLLQNPVPKENPAKEETKKESDINDIIKDSEVQPPNPVPPESHSAEVKEKETIVKPEDKMPEKVENKPKEVIPDIKETKIETNDVILPELNNVKSDIKEVIAKEDEKESDTKIEENKVKEEIIIKQAKLAETIKQHGEEQKELMKEQKEILNEMQKVKEKNANKIAVESIQKIANIAIKSLSQDSQNKPEEKLETVQKTEQVEDIVKKAVESIVAIKEIKDIASDVKKPEVNPVETKPSDVPKPVEAPQENRIQFNMENGKQGVVPNYEEAQKVIDNIKANRKFDENVNYRVKHSDSIDDNLNKVKILPKNEENSVLQPSVAKPIVLAMSETSQVSKQNLNNQIPEVKNIQNENSLKRDKREIDNVSDKNCDKNEINSQELLPKVDLNDALLRQPLNNVLIPGRSLKSVEDKT